MEQSDKIKITIH